MNIQEETIYSHNTVWDEEIKMCLSVLAVACLPLGVLWDTSWHLSIGRDTFWSPPHIVIYMGGVIPVVMFAWQTTAVRSCAPSASVSVLVAAL